MSGSPLARPTDAPPLAHVVDPAIGAPTTSAETSPTPAPPAEPLLDATDLPRHVAIIMDGNRRWARLHDLPELEGHAAGVEAIRILLKHAVRRGVPVMTLYAFSRENWARSDDEVRGLFGLLEQAIRSETAELREQGVRIRLLGRLEELPDDTRRSIGEAARRDAGGTRLLLNVAFNYAGRTELVDAVRRLAASGIAPEQINEDTISAALSRPALDPDLVIRTGGEQRLPTSSSGSRPTRSSTRRRSSGRTSARTPSTRRSSSSPDGPDGSGADHHDRANGPGVRAPAAGDRHCVLRPAVADRPRPRRAVDRRAHRDRGWPRRHRGLPAARPGGLSVDPAAGDRARHRRRRRRRDPDEPRRQRPHPRRDRDDPRRGRVVCEARPTRRAADVVRDRVRGAVRLAARAVVRLGVAAPGAADERAARVPRRERG